MKKFLIITFAILLGFPVFAQKHGQVFDNKKFSSKILGKDVSYTIYLPADYEKSERRYPVLYLLHGYSDDNTGWLQYGEMDRIADEVVDSGEGIPMIIVVADAEKTWYVNNYTGTYRYEDMYIKEFIPYIEKTYRARGTRGTRAISGLSMGGYGSFLYAMKHPDMFIACVPLSAAVFTDDEVRERFRDGKDTYSFQNLFGGNADNLSDYWRANSIIDLAKNMPDAQKGKVKFYVDCGDDDFLYKGNSTLHIVMRDNKIPHEYRVRDGAHNWTYWRKGLHDGLVFISNIIKH